MGSDEDKVLMETKIDKKSKQKYYLLFTSGPSDDTPLYFDSGKNTLLYEAQVTDVVITGTGVLYTISKSNHTFVRRRKFTYHNGALTEVPQPFYYVGLLSKTNNPITLFANSDLRARAK